MGNVFQLTRTRQLSSPRPDFQGSVNGKASLGILISRLENLSSDEDSQIKADKVSELLNEMLPHDCSQALDQARLCVLKSEAASQVEKQVARFMADNADRVLNLRDRVRYLQFAASHLDDPEQKQACQSAVMGALRQALKRGPADVVSCIHACFQTIDSTDEDLKPIIDFTLSEEFKSKAINPDNIEEYGDYASLRDLAYNLLDKAHVQGDTDMMRKAEEFLKSCDLPSILAAKADKPKP